MKPSRAIPTLLTAVVLAGSVHAAPATKPLSEQCLELSASDPVAALKLMQTELPRQSDAAAIAAFRLCRGHALL
ncbi:MAG TPA: hypothetical protein VFX55_11575, partial [Duganella sp.]|nr:hypothetical protein [Duganella sp.]